MQRIAPSSHRWYGVGAAVLALLILTPAVVSRGDDAELTKQPAREASQLVQAALEAELAGDAAKRAELLAQALTVDPECAPARWQSGQVKFEDQWRQPADVASRVTNNPRWVDYRELKAASTESPEDHLALAEYCRDNKLTHEGRYHWAIVLMASPENAEAREYLKLREFHGGLFTEAQIAELEKRAQDAETNLAHFTPRFAKLCRDVRTGDPAVRAAALAELRAVADPAAIAALEQAVAKAAAKSKRHAEELQLAVVAALSNMPQHEATLRLLNHAVFSDFEQVRTRAAEALRPRPDTDYVPLLMAALTAPIDVEIDVLASPDGTVRLLETVTQSGPEADRSHTRSTNFETDGGINFDPRRSNPAVVLDRNLSRVTSLAADTQARADAANAEAELRNERIQEALQIASGADLGTNPETWWGEWLVFNELQASEEPVYSTYEESLQAYYYPQLPMRYEEADDEESSAELRPAREPRRRSVGLRQTTEAVSHGRSRLELRQLGMEYRTTESPAFYLMSCFVPGTQVWTLSGPTAIEEISAGDLVLAQNPATGELDYRPVLRTTVGEPVRVLNIQVGGPEGETIGSTFGHRFWVSGRGWKMAKFLGPAARLHALGGPVEVEAISETEKAACYNLIVDDFHTFFVGESKLLVHDQSCPQPVLGALPGSSRMREPAEASSPTLSAAIR